MRASQPQLGKQCNGVQRLSRSDRKPNLAYDLFRPTTHELWLNVRDEVDMNSKAPFSILDHGWPRSKRGDTNSRAGLTKTAMRIATRQHSANSFGNPIGP